MVEINKTNFPDKNFRKWLLEQDYGKNGVITDDEIKSITHIDVSESRISSLKGIEHFTALKELSCGLNKLTNLDVSKNTALTGLYCSWNQLTNLDVSKNMVLEYLNCSDNQLEDLDVAGCMSLTNLRCGGNQLTTLDIAKNSELIELSCDNNQLTTLDVAGCMSLTWLNCGRNQLTALDVSRNKALKRLRCYANQIKGEAMDALISSLPQNETNNTNYWYIYNKKDDGNICLKAHVAAAKAKGWIPYCSDNDIVWSEYKGTCIEINEKNFPDKNFRSWLVSQSYCKSGVIDIKEVTSINVSGKGIKSLKGIEHFTELKYLYCYFNQLTDLDVSKNKALINLQCYANQIKGETMDGLINSLPQNETDNACKLFVYYDGNDGNVMTTTQTAAAKAKGWTPYYYNNDDWEEYEGSAD